MPSNFQLIAGLGNPGKEYAATRHNAGAWWLHKLCALHNATLQQANKFHSLVATLTINGDKLYCLLPTTYMNLSGKALASIANYYAINPEAILIVHDDLDLPVGKIKLKHGGGHGGHNGLKDIIAALQSNNFYRLRLGIGHPGNKAAVTNYVLQPPNNLEKLAINAAIEESLTLLPKLLNGNVAMVMEQLHNFSA